MMVLHQITRWAPGAMVACLNMRRALAIAAMIPVLAGSWGTTAAEAGRGPQDGVPVALLPWPHDPEKPELVLVRNLAVVPVARIRTAEGERFVPAIVRDGVRLPVRSLERPALVAVESARVPYAKVQLSSGDEFVGGVKAGMTIRPPRAPAAVLLAVGEVPFALPRECSRPAAVLLPLARVQAENGAGFAGPIGAASLPVAGSGRAAARPEPVYVPLAGMPFPAGRDLRQPEPMFVELALVGPMVMSGGGVAWVAPGVNRVGTGSECLFLDEFQERESAARAAGELRLAEAARLEKARLAARQERERQDEKAWQALAAARARSAAARVSQDPAERLPDEVPGLVTAMVWDRAGNLWLGSDGRGVWRWTPAGADATRGAWTPYLQARDGRSTLPENGVAPAAPAAVPTALAGLGENSITALACDRQGQVWAGHRTGGVSVFDGKSWRHYPAPPGLADGRVSDLAVSPADGDVWMAHAGGLTRYSPADGSWRSYTRADSLPAEEIQTLTVAADGTVLAGTLCSGLAVAAPTRDAGGGRLEYRHWRNVPGPEAPPMEAAGSGLPSGIIQDVLAAADGTWYAATPLGLAWSSDAGASWRYVRGRDWRERNRTVAGRAGAAEDDGEGTARGFVLLQEDDVTCLAEETSWGGVLVGHRRSGLEAVMLTGDRTGVLNCAVKTGWRAEDKDATWVSCLAPGPGRMAAGYYGFGPERLDTGFAGSKPAGLAQTRRPAAAAVEPLDAAHPPPAGVRELAGRS